MSMNPCEMCEETPTKKVGDSPVDGLPVYLCKECRSNPEYLVPKKEKKNDLYSS